MCNVESELLERESPSYREYVEEFPANEHLVPKWAAARAGAPRLAIENYYKDLAWAWPMLALRSRMVLGSIERGRDFEIDVIAVDGGVLTDALWWESEVPYPLPLRPIWPGFAVNTLSYAAILWLLICGPFVLRRLVRRRRGLCPACAYPMGDSATCTECGRELPSRARPAT